MHGGREIRRGRCEMGGFTVLPRWTREPEAGVGEHEVTVPDEVVAALRRVSDELGVSFSSVLLTAHAKVLGVLSSEPEVSTGYAIAGRPPLPCRMTTAPPSWREMLLETHRTAAALLPKQDFPIDDLRRDRGLAAPLFETLVDLNTCDGRELAEATVLEVGISERDGIALHVRYRTEAFDADC